VGWLVAESRALGVWLGGTVLLRASGGVYNTFVLAGPSGQLHQYAKRHPGLWEGCYFATGRAPVVAPTDAGDLGLMIGWDLTQPSAWASYGGQVEAVLAASAPPRLHRAVFNFPGGRKVYVAQLLPALLREREALDGLFSEYVGQCAAALGAPVIHAAMAGRFVAQLPLARLSWLGLAALQPRYWPLAAQARLATMRASFYGTTSIYAADGRAVASVGGEEGVALADVRPGGRAWPAQPIAPPRVPGALRALEAGLRPFARASYLQTGRHRPATG
jgi:predicted amidohydrolase